MTESTPNPELVEWMKTVAEIERDPAGERTVVVMGPYTAFCLIGALQLVTRHPEIGDILRGAIREVIDQLRPLFVGTPAEEIIRQGDHPEFDVKRATGPEIHITPRDAPHPQDLDDDDLPPGVCSCSGAGNCSPPWTDPGCPQHGWSERALRAWQDGSAGDQSAGVLDPQLRDQLGREGRA